MGEHRVPLLGSAWRRNEDPTLSRDPEVRALVGALATLPAPEMRPEFRTELRAQLVAIAPRIVAESAPAEARPRPRPTPQGRSTAARARHSESVLDRIPRIKMGRALGAVAALVVAFAVLLGGAVLLSKKALPGDALYGLKRASERFELATAGSDTEKANDYLDFAKTRVQEVTDLVGQHAGSDLIRSTLASSDGDVQAASRLLGSVAVQRNSAAPLAILTSWAPGQITRLRTVAAAMHDPAQRVQAANSLQVVETAAARAAWVRSALGCHCLSTKVKDKWGPLPAGVRLGPGGTVRSGPTGGATGGRNGSTTSPLPGVPVVPGVSGVPGVPAVSGIPGLSSAPAPSSSTAGGLLPIPVPSLGGGTGGGGLLGSSSAKPSPILNLPSLLPTKLPINKTTSTPTAPLPVSPTLACITVSLPVLGGGLGVQCPSP